MAGVSRSPDSLQKLSVGQHPAGVDRKLEAHPVLDIRQLYETNRQRNSGFGVGASQLAIHIIELSRIRRPGRRTPT